LVIDESVREQGGEQSDRCQQNPTCDVGLAVQAADVWGEHGRCPSGGVCLMVVLMSCVFLDGVGRLLSLGCG
jgi:hypothetical protein